MTSYPYAPDDVRTMKRLSIFVFLICAQCATLPREQRVSEEIFDTGITGTAAYDKALTWFAKNLNNANYAVQIRDRENAHIVSNAAVKCSEHVSALSMYGYEHFIGFSIDFKAKDGKARLRFEDISHYSIGNLGTNMGRRDERGPGSMEELEAINKLCIAPIKADFLKALRAANDDF